MTALMTASRCGCCGLTDRLSIRRGEGFDRISLPFRLLDVGFGLNSHLHETRRLNGKGVHDVTVCGVGPMHGLSNYRSNFRSAQSKTTSRRKT